MKITLARILMMLLSIVVGIVLVYAGLFAGWGLVWASGGTFFIARSGDRIVDVGVETFRASGGLSCDGRWSAF